MDSSWHPSSDALRRFALNDPSTEEADSFGTFASHLEECPLCRETLEDFARLTRGEINLPAEVPTVPGYEILDVIGRGGAGVVYRARQQSPSRFVALKFLPGGLLARASWRDRAIREASAAATVRHQNVVAVHEVGEAGGTPYLVMDLIEGGSLAKALRNGPLSPKDAAQLMEVVARAVGHMHRRSVLHLDLKPANILLDDSTGQLVPMVSDFGIARVLDDPGTTLTTTHAMLGTPQYMAPEQAGGAAKGALIREPADIYALGATLYHAFTGRPPFQAASMLETLDLVRESTPVAPRQLQPNLPRDLETVVLKCLEKSPSRRYATADDLADDLRRSLDGHPVHARRVSKAVHAWRWCRRHPAIASLASLLALTVVGSVAMLVMLLRWADDERLEAKKERIRAVESRKRADDNEQFSARAADELIVLVKSAVRNRTPLSRTDVVSTLLKLREAASRLEGGERILVSLSGLENEIAWGYLLIERNEEAKRIYRNNAENLDTISQNNYVGIRSQDPIERTIYHSGIIAFTDGKLEEALKLFEQSAETHLRAQPGQESIEGLRRVYVELTNLSDSLYYKNLPTQAERALRACEGILSRLKSIQRERPEDGEVRHCLADVLACTVGSPFSPSHPLAPSLKYEKDPEAWARAVVSVIDEQYRALHRGDSPISLGSIMTRLRDRASLRAAYERKCGRIDDARRTVGMLLAIARTLVLDYPDQADSHLVLCDAYNQVAKNAWQTDDQTTIHLSMRQAIDAARVAVKLEPARDDARHYLVKLSGRLKAFEDEMPRAEPENANGTKQ